MLNSILPGTVEANMTVIQFLACTLASLGLGFLLAIVHQYKNASSKNFLLTLTLLPAVVQAIIMIVNGNLGTGVAVMGAFSLVRFRSVPGNSKEIGSIFLAMAIGLATGMGYLGIAVMLFFIMAAASLVLVTVPLGQGDFAGKELKITLPENLDYAGIFEEIFNAYTKDARLVRVRTTNMGSLYELTYHIQLKAESLEKPMIDDIRTKNGNLPIICGYRENSREEL